MDVFEKTRRLLLAIAGASLLLPSSDAAAVDFKRVQIDPLFRAEGVAAGDFNHDGLMDIAAGDVWYAAPDWKRYDIRPAIGRDGKPTEKYDGNTGYSNCFASWAWDINQDDWTDLIIVGFPGAPFYWYENPKDSSKEWVQHEIWHSICNETPLFTDITGDGRPDLIFGSQPERQMGYIEIPALDKIREKWVFVPVSEPGEPHENGTFMYYHGLGAGDINQDGKADILIPHGWWEGPKQQSGSPWVFHPWKLAVTPEKKPLPASNLHVIDLDLDGDQDVVMSSAHAYGIWWFENPGGDGSQPFKYHLIDESFSQTHALEMVNLTGKGNPCLVTGKRYFAHQGGDPGGRDPAVMYWFEIERQKGAAPKFVKHEIVEGRDTGVGTQFQMADMNKDGKLDVVLSNKKGVNLLLQK